VHTLQCLANSVVNCRPNGKSLFRNAELEKQGWHVVIVPWFEWKHLLSYTARLAYLEKKIGDVVLRHALDARLQHQHKLQH